MASNQLSRAESWEKIHEAFSQVNFNSFDYATVKESLLEYMKLYHVETFNDMIESSEFIAVLELFCYVAELAAYRVDMNAHENFLPTANRKESILRLAKFISYKPSRNIPARGLVKLTAVSTTENVYDSIGRNLANVRINWNDPNNVDWKEHFILVVNKVIEQSFGSVTPNERKQFENVLFELYSLNNNSLGIKSVLQYTSSSSGQSLPMELVPVALTDNGPEEKRPEVNAKFTLLYGSDGLGDSSDMTGFFMFTKQGTIQKVQTTFDGVTPNQIFEIKTSNINETDVWINNVDPDTRAILINDPYASVLPHLTSTDSRYGEWFEVDISNAQNIIFNTNKNRKKYEIETLDNDQIKIIFGDGEFADIPSGSFDIWYRTSANTDLPISKSSVQGVNSSFTYTDANSYTQTFTFTFSLVSSLQNSSKSEDIEHIRNVAPSVYYTQDRMVNGRDYNTFMLKDPSILKMYTINRTFAGDSKYMAWHDPKESYENVKIFGDDLALYWDERIPQNGNTISVDQPYTGELLLSNYIEPILSGTDFFAVVASESNSILSVPVRKSFTTAETALISGELNTAQPVGGTVTVYYNITLDVFTTTPGSGYQDIIIVQSILDPVDPIGWTIQYRNKKLIAHSEKIKFWNANTTDQIVNYDSLNAVQDNICVLKANVNGSQNGILSSNHIFPILSQCLLEHPLEDIGLPDTKKLSVITEDVSNDGIPDNLTQSELMLNTLSYSAISDLTYIIDSSDVVITLPNSLTYVTTEINEEVQVYVNSTLATISAYSTVPDVVQTQIRLVGIGIGSIPQPITIILKNYVYMTRESTDSNWVPLTETTYVKRAYAENISGNNARYPGRYPLNFAWFHYVDQLNLVDPAASNIMDMFIITKGYYHSMLQWVNGNTDVKPTKPTSLALRSSYAELLDNAMISDTIVLHSADFKILFGSKASSEVQCKFKVIRPNNTSLTDNELKVKMVDIVRSFFDIDYWDFGQVFYFTQLASVLQTQLSTEIDSIVIVPVDSSKTFGDMFQVSARENELFIPDISVNDIEIIQSFTQENIKQS